MGSESRLSSVGFCLFDSPLNSRGASRNSGIGLCNKEVACVEEDRPIRCDTAAANFRRYRARGNIPTSCQGTYPCGMQSGALALTYTGEVFYVEEKSTVVQLTPMFADGELVYLEGICSGPNGMLYVAAYEEDGMAICQATLEGKL